MKRIFWSIGLGLSACYVLLNACTSSQESELDITPSEKASLWPQGILVYEIGENTSPAATSKAIKAAQQINANTNIIIVPKKIAERRGYNTDNVVKITSADNGCSMSRLGYSENPSLNLGPNCSVGNAMHEFYHALGIEHEQLNPNFRGKIQFDRIQERYVSQFQSKTASGEFEYDPHSIMHYDSFGFSVCSDPENPKVQENAVLKQCADAGDWKENDACATECAVILNEDDELIGSQRSYLTDHDIQGINALYQEEIEKRIANQSGESGPPPTPATPAESTANDQPDSPDFDPSGEGSADCHICRKNEVSASGFGLHDSSRPTTLSKHDN